MMAGLVASSLIGLVYLTMPALAAFTHLCKEKKDSNHQYRTGLVGGTRGRVGTARGVGELAGSLLAARRGQLSSRPHLRHRGTYNRRPRYTPSEQKVALAAERATLSL